MMKKLLIIASFLFIAVGTAAAMDHSSHSMSAPRGEKIRSAMVQGYHLEYYLIDMKAEVKEKGLKAAPGMKSHHLMLYVTKNGKMIADGKVGYLITNANGNKQKVMTMAMNMGHGGDVDLKAGENRVKTKIMVAGEKLIDEFNITR